MKTIGILGLQGDFARHAHVVERLGARAPVIVSPDGIDGIDGLIIPGGESTTIGKLMVDFALLEPIKQRISAGMPVFGTCAGMILLAERITGSNQPRIGVLDIEVNRNAYGRQVVSFEADVPVSFAGERIHGVFIRAPQIVDLGSAVQVLGEFEDRPVIVRQQNILACSFHHELTEDTRTHEYYLRMA